MERLTEHHVNKTMGAYMVCSAACIDDDFDCNDCKKLAEIVDRLAAYEDTGLEPEEISILCSMSERAKMADLLRLEEYQVLGSIDHLRELAQAEKDGRLLVLPPNAPLTLEELREMDGEPVWIYNGYNGWINCRVVECMNAEYIFFTDGTARRMSCYGEAWLAYRRKPEEGTTC